MIYIQSAFSQEEQRLELVGRQGEGGTRQLVFDCADVLAEYPDALIVCAMQRAGDRKAYLKDCAADGANRAVTLESADVAVPGVLKIELRALIGDDVRKSAVYIAKVAESLRGEQDKPGNPTADVLNRIDMTISRAEKSIAEADAAAKSAQTVADTVQAKLDNGDFVGPAGKPGSDASVTSDNIKTALGYTPVKDVQLNGESLVQDSMATIPLVGYNRLGAVQLDPAGFAAASVEGKLALVPPTDAQISTHTYTQRPITPSCMDYAVTAAMTDGKGPAWTATEQKAARERMGIDKAYELIEEIVLSEDTGSLVRTTTPAGTSYNYSAIQIWIVGTNASGSNKFVRFGASSTTYSVVDGAISGVEKNYYTYCKIEIKNQMVDAIANGGPGYQGPVSRKYEAIPLHKAGWPEGTITDIRIACSELITAGTKITIYGVRA